MKKETCDIARACIKMIILMAKEKGIEVLGKDEDRGCDGYTIKQLENAEHEILNIGFSAALDRVFGS